MARKAYRNRRITYTEMRFGIYEVQHLEYPARVEAANYRDYWRIHSEEGEEIPALPSDRELYESRLENLRRDADISNIVELP